MRTCWAKRERKRRMKAWRPDLSLDYWCGVLNSRELAVFLSRELDILQHAGRFSLSGSSDSLCLINSIPPNAPAACFCMK